MSRIFEQPLSEKLRTYLRIEQTFERFATLVASTDRAVHYAAFAALFELMEMTDHGDLRADLHSDLDKQLQQIATYRNNPQVDQEKLLRFELQLKKLHQWIVNFPGKFTAKLKDNEFLYAVKHRYALPGGTVACDLPRLHVFLNQTPDFRRQRFEQWLFELQGVRTSVDVLLRLMRDNSHWREVAFDEGYFQLEPVQGQLLRLKLISEPNHFPEVSSGKQRCIIRLAQTTPDFGVTYVKDSSTFEYALVG